MYDYKKLRNKTDILIAGGEYGTWRSEFYEFIKNEAFDIIQPDCTHAGGIRETKRICEIAELNNILVAPHIWASAPGLLANLHLIITTPNCIFAEYSQMPNPFRTDLLEEKLEVKEGFIKIPKVYGLGVKIKEEHFKKYPYNEDALPSWPLNN